MLPFTLQQNVKPDLILDKDAGDNKLKSIVCNATFDIHNISIEYQYMGLIDHCTGWFGLHCIPSNMPVNNQENGLGRKCYL